jgi:hypothetical protein
VSSTRGKWHCVGRERGTRHRSAAPEEGPTKRGSGCHCRCQCLSSSIGPTLQPVAAVPLLGSPCCFLGGEEEGRAAGQRKGMAGGAGGGWWSPTQGADSASLCTATGRGQTGDSHATHGEGGKAKRQQAPRSHLCGCALMFTPLPRKACVHAGQWAEGGSPMRRSVSAQQEWVARCAPGSDPSVHTQYKGGKHTKRQVCWRIAAFGVRSQRSRLIDALPSFVRCISV